MTDNEEEIDYPVLGEPVVIEFANTLYRYQDQTIDFLESPALIVGWFAASPTATVLTRPATFSQPMVDRLGALRDAVHAVIAALIDGASPGRGALTIINEHAVAGARRASLGWTEAGPQRREHTTASGMNALLGRLALDCIELVTGPHATAVRRCDAADCPMFFVKDHSRRRWCHNGCGHRDRQSRYYMRRKTLALPSAKAPAEDGNRNA